MTDKQDITGFWWFPDSPGERWAGTLTVAPKTGPRLELTIPKAFWGFENRPRPAVIQGHDTGGTPITLLFPGYAGGPSGMAISQPSFSAGFAIHGIHIASPTDFQINSLTVMMQHLHAWSELSGIQRTPAEPIDEIAIRYRPPDAITYTIGGTLDVEFFVSHSTHNGFQEQSIAEETSITFKSATGLSLQECLRLMNSIRQLLHFATLERVYPTEMSAWKTGYGIEHEGRIIEKEIKLYNSINHSPAKSEFQRERWLFRFSDLRQDFANVFSKWLAYIETYREAVDCYSATVYHRFPSEMEFLCLAQALEAYDGIRRGRQIFIDRIQTLTTSCLPYLKGLVTDAQDFSKTVRDNRNYFTHHDPNIKQAGRVLSGAELIRMNEKLKIIFQICVLSDLGIPADRFGRLRKNLASEIVEYTTG